MYVKVNLQSSVFFVFFSSLLLTYKIQQKKEKRAEELKLISERKECGLDNLINGNILVKQGWIIHRSDILWEIKTIYINIHIFFIYNILYLIRISVRCTNCNDFFCVIVSYLLKQTDILTDKVIQRRAPLLKYLAYLSSSNSNQYSKRYMQIPYEILTETIFHLPENLIRDY